MIGSLKSQSRLSPFQTLVEIGQKAFNVSAYGSAKLDGVAELLLQGGWIKQQNRLNDCHTCIGVLYTLRDIEKLDLAPKTQTSQGVIMELNMERYAERVVAHATSSITSMTDEHQVFGLGDGSLLLLTNSGSGISLKAFMSDRHNTTARNLARQTDYYHQALAGGVNPELSIGSHLSPYPKPKPQFPNAIGMNVFPKTRLKTRDGAYASGKDTDWCLELHDAKMADLLTRKGLTFAPVVLTLNQIQLR